MKNLLLFFVLIPNLCMSAETLPKLVIQGSLDGGKKVGASIILEANNTDNKDCFEKRDGGFYKETILRSHHIQFQSQAAENDKYKLNLALAYHLENHLREAIDRKEISLKKSEIQKYIKDCKVSISEILIDSSDGSQLTLSGQIRKFGKLNKAKYILNNGEIKRVNLPLDQSKKRLNLKINFL